MEKKIEEIKRFQLVYGRWEMLDIWGLDNGLIDINDFLLYLRFRTVSKN